MTLLKNEALTRIQSLERPSPLTIKYLIAPETIGKSFIMKALYVNCTEQRILCRDVFMATSVTRLKTCATQHHYCFTCSRIGLTAKFYSSNKMYS